MSSHALSDDQVASELKKMTAFIRQEALEKAREIELKADEEFAIEKSKLVREEIAAIDAEYEKKFKQASMSQQITRSTMANKTRIKVLSARQELLDKLFEQARAKLAEAGPKSKNYEDILKGLILECLYLLCEKKVTIRCRKADKDKVQRAAKKASAEYKEKMGSDVEAVVDENEWLPEESAGGVFVIGGNGKIELNNTFEERLRMCETEALPSLRATLFGENKNRKFHD
ncbi:V-ATPase V1 sector subunit E [Exophiala dermatitidis]|uniref:ATP synthase (E/31 kDa) subunit n=2 Tax=Exophiala dermatitidis TaxID=5970 RepID=H6BYR6_EXODN|nr:ATP synthase (E/31 kDa) subunit [Exophiala dermatitidis NIH/UT8656]KAJ4520173.1 V-ATPase V1 sector subunit E [Exophiala dermatitidis]EHY56779.1 ATP synthase (E/31 kDa) subunit [Exophiala dermatitidis NIH/UT8656]KAJ4524022.1 V-ATPase V1 sector subunit E [Exophiala dermatitidis]KAJ4525707.1 V-ATPase V1 sector subunit E [Exophiala dermatitidis]KAJ4537031.1 V-ATPase V1 sector subunit E [Exophiala dermatitidis]